MNASYISDQLQRKLGVYKIKYKVLDELLDENNIDKIESIHINCDSIINHLYKSISLDEDIRNGKLSLSISSSLLNLVGHFKHYFTKKEQNVTIYLYFFKTYPTDSNLNCELNEIKSIMSLICKYLPNIYYIESVNDNIAVTIKYFCKKNNLIISRSMNDMLLVNKDTYGFRIMNKNNVIPYTVDNFFNAYLKEDKEKNKISSNFFTIALAFAGFNGLAGVKGIGPHKIIKIINNALSANELMDIKYPDIRLFIEDVSKLSSIDCNKAIKNFYEIDIDYNYEKYISSSNAVKMKLNNYIITKFAKNEIAKISKTYFKDLDFVNFDYLFEEFRKKVTIW